MREAPLSDLALDVRRAGLLKSAWNHVRRSALASDSPETRADAQAFDMDSTAHLNRIQRQLQRGKYRFDEAQAVLKRRKGKAPRPIVVATTRDRVVQRALLEVVLSQATVAQATLTPWSYGGLKDRGVPDAVRRVCEVLQTEGQYYLKSDIAGFFTRIPRQRALAELQRLLPDNSIAQLLDDATRVELRDPLFLRDDIKLFPSHELGVAQGCCLSPLLGNVLLREFDSTIGSLPSIHVLRYIDDVLILGPDRHRVRHAFRAARRILENLGFDLYDPAEESAKASEGTTRRGFEYLGCRISRSHVTPSAEVKTRIKKKLGLLLSRGQTGLVKGSFDTPAAYDLSLLEVLGEVSNIIRGWSNQYSFCNADGVMRQLDSWVATELGRYLGTYSDRRKRKAGPEAQRMLGVRLFEDGKRAPIYPLGRH